MLTREKLHLHFLSISTDLSFAQQKVLASRKELLEYDCRECKGPESSSSGSLLLTSGSKGLPGECYGCASAAIEHCVTLLRALAMVPGTRKQLVEEVTIVEAQEEHRALASLVDGLRRYAESPLL